MLTLSTIFKSSLVLAAGAVIVCATLVSAKSLDKDHKKSAKAVKGMIWIAGGSFWMGCDQPPINDASPVHQVVVDGFWIDKTEVTNKEFTRFVHATHYQTLAERYLNPNDYPHSRQENLIPGAMVFGSPKSQNSLRTSGWWHFIPGANWQHPEGPKSNLKGRSNYPVVEVSWADANAYAKWAGKRLPTEAEFEYASRGGLDRNKFSWGNELMPAGQWMTNIWQGNFPQTNTHEDGFERAAPVCSFPPNGYAVYDLTGNVWEWCSDWYRPNYATQPPGELIKNPVGPVDSFDPTEPKIAKRVLRGGSFLCTDQYCSRYYVGARGKGEPTAAWLNVGIRCVRN